MSEPKEYETPDDVPSGNAVSTCCGAAHKDGYMHRCPACQEHCGWYDEEDEL